MYEGNAGRNSRYEFSYLCHLDNVLDGKAGHIDRAGNVINARQTETKDLCIECYDRVMIEAVKKFRELRAIKMVKKFRELREKQDAS